MRDCEERPGTPPSRGIASPGADLRPLRKDPVPCNVARSEVGSGCRKMLSLHGFGTGAGLILGVIFALPNDERDRFMTVVVTEVRPRFLPNRCTIAPRPPGNGRRRSGRRSETRPWPASVCRKGRVTLLAWRPIPTRLSCLTPRGLKRHPACTLFDCRSGHSRRVLATGGGSA